MPPIDCPFRWNVRRTSAGEVATCGLIQQMTGARDASFCDVDRDACEVCIAALPGRAAALNPVIPSLVHTACERLHAAGARTARSESLLSWSRATLADEPATTARSGVACDAIVCCRESSSRTRAAIESILDQQDCLPFVHLVDLGDASAVIAHFSNLPNVAIRRFPDASPWAVVQQLLGRLTTPFVAIQDPATISDPRRLAWAVSRLIDDGGEFYASSLSVDGRPLHSEAPAPSRYQRTVQPQTLVMRRAALIDMGGINDRPDADVELMYRAARESRTIVVDRVATVAAAELPVLSAVGSRPMYGSARVLRGHAPGFAQQRPACDVVVPFRGRVDLLEEALASLVDQRAADVVIHLVDDASDDDGGVLQRWSQRANVRTYRNRRNIGPFASFNNLAAFCETGFAAVQDADDVSLPRRLSWACNALRLAGGELFGGALRLFGDDAMQQRLTTDTESNAGGETVRIRRSVYPNARTEHCFLQNPTLVVRTDAFRWLGGYADFGDRRRNRTGVDTEFQLRAACAGCALFISHEAAVRYRCHPDSATWHSSTGMGSTPNREATAERQRRLQVYRAATFHPASFGALDRHVGVTERLKFPG